MTVKIGKNVISREHISALLRDDELVVMHKFIVRTGRKAHRHSLRGTGGRPECNVKRGKHRRRVVLFSAAVLGIFFKMRTVGFGTGYRPIFADDLLMVEVHARDPHIAVSIDLHEETLREFILVEHRGIARHVLILSGFDRHISDRAAAKRGKSGLHDAARIVQREMQMSAERHGLRIFVQNLRQILGIPIGAEIAAVYGVVDHRMREDEYELIRVFRRHLRERLVEPFQRVIGKGDRILRRRKHRDHMEAVDHAVTVAHTRKRFCIDIRQEIIVAEQRVDIFRLRRGIRRPPALDVMISGRVDHRNLGGRKYALINGLEIICLLIFPAVTGVDDVSYCEYGIKTVRVVEKSLRLQLLQCALKFFRNRIRRAVHNVHVADRGKRKYDIVGIKLLLIRLEICIQQFFKLLLHVFPCFVDNLLNFLILPADRGVDESLHLLGGHIRRQRLSDNF